MNVAFFSSKKYDIEYFDRVDTPHSFTYFETSLNKDTLNLTKDFDAVCIFVNDYADAQVLEGLAKNGVKLVALRSAGFNNVDLDTAKKLGLTVVRVPTYSPEAVAEHALALILTLNRKIHKAYNRIRESNFSLEGLTGFNIHGKQIGVIGTGQIGRAFCKIMSGFGCKIVAYDIYEQEDLKQNGITYMSLNDVIASSDIISLHCPLTPETHHLLNSETFKTMKKGAMVINTSRGGLIDTTAAIEALKSGQLGYLAIDVYEQEENLFFKDLSGSIILDDVIIRLLAFPNVIVTSHQGFFTNEALDEIARTTVFNIDQFQNGEPLDNEVKS